MGEDVLPARRSKGQGTKGVKNIGWEGCRGQTGADGLGALRLNLPGILRLGGLPYLPNDDGRDPFFGQEFFNGPFCKQPLPCIVGADEDAGVVFVDEERDLKELFESLNVPPLFPMF